MTKQPMRVCRRCGRVLAHRVDGGYTHALVDQNQDHEAEPVSPEEAVTLGRCDVCFAELPDWVVPCRDFEVVAGHRSGGDWAVCDECVRLIERNQWSALWRRARKSWESRHGDMPAPVESGLKHMYRLFRKNITGGPRPNPYRLAASRLGELGADVSGDYGLGHKTSET